MGKRIEDHIDDKAIEIIKNATNNLESISGEDSSCLSTNSPLLAPETENTKGGFSLSVNWPDPLDDEAFYGLAGDIVKAIEPHTESDPAALLLSLLTLFGNCIGRTAHFIAEADYHYMNLFVCLVGATAKGRKGSSLGHIKKLFEDVDENWAKENLTQGLSSGEGLIWAVRDEQTSNKKNSQGENEEVIIVDGVRDKRITVIETEFASTLRVLRREGNTLSAIIRKAWDDGDLNALTKNNPAKATGAYVSILGHITKNELLKHFYDTEAANGFGNRFLWACVCRSKCLPEGGSFHKVDATDLKERLKQAVDFAKQTGEMKRDEEARQLWHNIYPELSEGKPGLCGSMLARAEAQVMRLSCIYALLDSSATVKCQHMRAALAIWDYLEASTKFIFGESLGDSDADDILDALRKAGMQGLTRTEITNFFSRNKNTREITRALNQLSEMSLAYSKIIYQSRGRPIEKWYIVNPVTN